MGRKYLHKITLLPSPTLKKKLTWPPCVSGWLQRRFYGGNKTLPPRSEACLSGSLLPAFHPPWRPTGHLTRASALSLTPARNPAPSTPRDTCLYLTHSTCWGRAALITTRGRNASPEVWECKRDALERKEAPQGPPVKKREGFQGTNRGGPPALSLLPGSPGR